MTITDVLIKTESHYLVDRKRIRKVVAKVLQEKIVKGNVEVSISITGDRMMKRLNKKYRNLDETTDVLSFPLTQNGNVPFAVTPDGILRLGDIVISYPAAREEAREENKLVDDTIDELVVHGMLHLLGINPHFFETREEQELIRVPISFFRIDGYVTRYILRLSSSRQINALFTRKNTLP